MTLQKLDFSYILLLGASHARAFSFHRVLIIWPAESSLSACSISCVSQGPCQGTGRPHYICSRVCVCVFSWEYTLVQWYFILKAAVKSISTRLWVGGLYELQSVCVEYSLLPGSSRVRESGNREIVTLLTSCFGIDSCQMGLSEVNRRRLATAVLHL